jgi:hypothetical protein
LAILIYPLYLLFFGWEEDVATISLDNSYSIHIWEEFVGILDDGWDPDIGSPLIFYEVKKSDIPIVSKSWLELDFGYDYDIKFEFIPKGVFVCHQDINHRDKIIEFVVGIEKEKVYHISLRLKQVLTPKLSKNGQTLIDG